jgi:hypothetical protein
MVLLELEFAIFQNAGEKSLFGGIYVDVLCCENAVTEVALALASLGDVTLVEINKFGETSITTVTVAVIFAINLTASFLDTNDFIRTTICNCSKVNCLKH